MAQQKADQELELERTRVNLREDCGWAILDLVQDALHDAVDHTPVMAAEDRVCPHGL